MFEEFIIEVELAPGVENIDELLSGINAAPPPSGGVQESDFARVARTHGVVEAQPVFTSEEVEQRRARIDARRNEIAAPENVGGSLEDVSEQLSQLDQLPPLTNFVTLRFPPGTSVDAVLAQLNALPQVKQAVVVPEAAPPDLPNDPYIGTEQQSPVEVAHNQIQRQWYLHRTRVPQAWQFGRGAGVVIADVDFGCRVSHREFVGAIKHTHNSFDGTDNVSCGADVGHGTAVLGIAGARSDGKGLAGYAPEAELWAIQGNTGCGPPKNITPWLAAINHILDTDAPGKRKVILIELQTKPLGGNYEQVPTVNDLIREAIAQNCVVVVCAGNGNRRVNLKDNNQPFEPTGSILVGATIFHETENRRAPFSNHGPEVVVSAPGDKIRDVTCGPSEDTAYRNDFGGTSGAAAKVAGTVALMLSVNPNLSHAAVREILRTTGSPIITDSEKPVGVFLNAEAAVVEARNRLNQ
ncbi:MAG: S8 family serine peptidase [Acidobacteria bacterium]|nr:S8 family serine peptidase [Acidobacteriota bacterium]